jgi:hypothetical protein|nr:MAG TPA: restriction alleviation protein [Caudoviricetes sp.]
MKAKRCPVCGGKPKYVHYSIPGATKDPDGLYILFKRLECEKCGATVASLVLTCDDAVEYWNSLTKEGKRVVLERVMEEPCRDVEDADHDDTPEELEGLK